jgi:predicted outer membrane repeat protein
MLAKNLTLIGDNQNNTIITGQGNVDMVISSENRVTITRLTVKNSACGIWNCGLLNLTNSTITLNNGPNSSGGICNSGVMDLCGVTITGNNAPDGGGIYSGKSLTLKNSTIANNYAKYGGGGLYNLVGTANIGNSTIISNQATEGGGICSKIEGIYNWGTYLTIIDSTIANNIVKGRGGGIFSSRLMTIYGSTITGNIAHNGGGIFSESTSYIDDLIILLMTNNTPNDQEGNPHIPT